MASRKGISYLWRIFLPYVIALWVVIIGMAAWQAYRVTEIKKEMVIDQLALVANRIATLYNGNEVDHIESFSTFVNDYYKRNHSYDPINIRISNPDGSIILNLGDAVSPDYPLPTGDGASGMFVVHGEDNEASDDDQRFVYYNILSNDGKDICVMLPFTKDIAVAISPVTTRFWLIFFGIAIFVTIFAYVWSLFFSQNIRILKDFATRAAKNPKSIDTEFHFPHDELGDISRQILKIYNERMEEMEQRERDHKVALHAIEEKQRIKKELTGNINHELKTPVGVIQGYIDTIISNPDMDAELRNKFLIKAQQNVHRLSALIADITAITKLESGGKLVNVEEVNFHDLVYTLDNFVKEAQILPEEIEFRYDIPMGCSVVGNESLLNTVLLNLIKNTAAYSHGTECCLEFIGEDDELMHFRFYDNGVGVPPECLPHMFERFFRVNAGRSRDSGGTGLGLAIVEVTITSFGGTISVANRQPSGLEYKFSLPRFKRQQ